MKRGKAGGEGPEARVSTFEFRGQRFAVVSHPSAEHVTHDSLTAAEREVTGFVVAGRSNAQIARARGTSVNTVGNQIASIFRKLGVGSRFELIARARGGQEQPE